MNENGNHEDESNEPSCEICGQEEGFVTRDGTLYGIECAFLAGNREAAMIKAQQSVDELLRTPEAAKETYGF